MASPQSRPTIRPGPMVGSQEDPVRRSFIRAKVELDGQPESDPTQSARTTNPPERISHPSIRPRFPSGTFGYRELLKSKNEELKKSLMKIRDVHQTDGTVIKVYTHQLKDHKDPKAAWVAFAVHIYQKATALFEDPNSTPSSQKEMNSFIDEANQRLAKLSGIWNNQ